MKIIAIGWNYANHNSEMGRVETPTTPTIFMKPDTSILKDGKDFYIPDFSDQIEYETEIVIRISRVGKNISAKFANRYYDAVTVGIDVTARDLQERLRKEGQPWEISKAFDNSAIIGEFSPTEDLNMQDLHFKMELNGEKRQEASSSEMIFSIDQIVEYVSRYVTLKKGDLIFTGTPTGVGRLAIGDKICGYLQENKVLEFSVK
ncbi:MAG: fumarylacetoacetate hydrolase family protein [Bacteroidales bacterium]